MMNEQQEQIKKGTHKQFELRDGVVKCKCDYNKPAIWWKTGYICRTITAYPCKYS